MVERYNTSHLRVRLPSPKKKQNILYEDNVGFLIQVKEVYLYNKVGRSTFPRFSTHMILK